MSEKNLKNQRDKVQEELAFRYYNDLGPGRSVKEVARYMRVHERTAQRWAFDNNWNDRVDNSQPLMSRLMYSSMQLEQVVREEILREINFLYRSVEELILTMFEKDESDDFILINGSYVLKNHLQINSVKDLKDVIRCFKELSDLKLTAVNGVGAQDKSDIIRQITERREKEGWDVFRTMKECEIILGKIPDFLKQEAIILKAKEAQEHGDVVFNIVSDDPDEDISDVEIEMIDDEVMDKIIPPDDNIEIKTRENIS